MKIGIVSWHVCSSYGGTEKFSVTLANEMSKRGHGVALFYSTEQENLDSAFMLQKISSCVELRNIFLNTALFNEPGKLNKFDINLHKAAQIINKSNVDVLVVIVGWYAADLICAGLLKYLQMPVLTSVRNSPSKINAKYSMQEHAALILSSTNIHVLFESFKQFYPSFMHSKICDIPNAIELNSLSYKKQKIHQKRVVALGRFDDSTKKFSLLIEAFSRIRDDFPEWTLTICGDGPSMNEYHQLITRLKLNSCVFFPGAVPSPDPYFKYSDIFCIPSAYEGFPNVLLEAQSFFLPAVGFKDCYGVNELIIPGYNGFLANEMTSSALAEEIKKLMKSGELRSKCGENSYESLSRYDFNVAFNTWENIIFKTAKQISPCWTNENSEEFFIKSLHSSITQYSMNYCKNIYQINKKLKKIAP